MGDEIQDPKRNLPFAIFWGGLAAGAIYLGTTLAMLIAMPQHDIGILSGILQGINLMASRTGLMAVVVPIAVLECISILGTASAWFSGTARLPFVAGIDRYLPAVIGKIHPKYGTPHISLILFAALSSLLIGGSFFGASGRGRLSHPARSRRDHAAASLLLYVPCATQTHSPSRERTQSHQTLPLANCIAGLTVTGVGICVAFIPSRQVNSVWIYELKLVLGCAIVFGTAYFFYRRSLRNAHQAVLLEVTAADAS